MLPIGARGLYNVLNASKVNNIGFLESKMSRFDRWIMTLDVVVHQREKRPVRSSVRSIGYTFLLRRVLGQKGNLVAEVQAREPFLVAVQHSGWSV